MSVRMSEEQKIETRTVQMVEVIVSQNDITHIEAIVECPDETAADALTRASEFTDTERSVLVQGFDNVTARIIRARKKETPEGFWVELGITLQ